MIPGARADTAEAVAAWTFLLVASVAIHVAEEVDVPPLAQQAITQALQAAVESVLEEKAALDAERGCTVPEDCARDVLDRTGAEHLVLVYIYAGVDRTLVLVRRAGGSGFLSSEELIVSKDGQAPVDWNGAVARSFWDLMPAGSEDGNSGLLGPVSLMAVGTASLLTSVGFGLAAGHLSNVSIGLVDSEVSNHLGAYDATRTTSFALLGVGVGLVIAGGLWAVLRGSEAEP